MSDFGNLTTPTARKRHRCDWCYGPIPAGEKYTRWEGVFDGRWQSNAMHEECHDTLMSDESGDYEYIPGEGEMPERVKALIALEGKHGIK